MMLAMADLAQIVSLFCPQGGQCYAFKGLFSLKFTARWAVLTQADPAKWMCFIIYPI